MAELNNVRDGRKAKVYLLEHATTAAATLALGKIYCITGIGSTTIFGNLKVGDYFIATGTAAPTLGTGDSCVEVTPHFFGGATDKDLNFEKSTTDITCDKDAAANVTSNGVVTGNGTIAMYDLIQTGDTALNRIKKRFNKVVTYTSGVPTGAELDRTQKDVFMFVWDARDLETGEYMAFDFVPAFAQSLGHSSAYGSGQTAPVGISCADTDEAGHRRSFQIVEYQSELGAQIEAWDAA
ncbi:MAG: hypothetical protein IJT52_03330 [Spirochaetales bacterium]|nr:hypothetical protein [Spirochaetales bacterium]